MVRFLFVALALSCCAVSFADETEAVVRVTAGNSVGSGTFFFLDDSGNYYALTNHHVAGRKGSRVGVELWAGGKLQTRVPGVVVRAEIDSGYTDVSVVRVDQASLGELKPPIVPLKNPGTGVGADEVIASRGCPGGTWATYFVGRTFQADEKKMEFYPRPGGGRSGSAIVQDGKIVGLLTWSTGKPGQESHGVDGYGYRSGNGIAQQIETVWRVLRGTVSADRDIRPESYTPLVWHRYATQQDPDFSLTPEEQEALQRRLRDRGGDGDKPGILPERPERPAPLRNAISKIIIVAGFLVLAAIVVGIVYAVQKFRGVLVIAGVCLLPMSAYAQDSKAQPELQRLAENWRMEDVSQVDRWGTYDSAYDAVSTDKSRSIVTLITIPNCPACERLKTQLREADKFGWLNGAETAIVDATAQPELAAALSLSQKDAAFPRLVVQVPVETPEGRSIRVVIKVGCFPETEGQGFAASADIDKEGDAAAEPATVEQFLAMFGVR